MIAVLTVLAGVFCASCGGQTSSSASETVSPPPTGFDSQEDTFVSDVTLTDQGSGTTPPVDTTAPEVVEPDGEVSGLPCVTSSDCPVDRPICAPQGVCILCYPGTKACEGEQSMVCETFGGFYLLSEDCALAGNTCNEVSGLCEGGCGFGGGIYKTNAGCEFFAVDLENALVFKDKFYDAQNAQFAVIASNTSTDQPAEVSVTLPDGSVLEKSVAPLSLETFLLPPDFGLTGTDRAMAAYRIQSSQPITAYQFNPLSNVGVFSNDASVLLPLSSLGKEYFVATLPQASDDFRGYFSIAATTPGVTQVTVTPRTMTEPGADIPLLVKNQPHSLSLNFGEVVVIQSRNVGGDLTGSRIVADKAVQVMAGHVAAQTSDSCCADHLEQQLAPVSTWGKDYLVGRSVERGIEPDYIRVVAAYDNTEVSLSPAVTVPSSKILQRGDMWAFKTDTHLRVIANKPIMVVQFLASSYETASTSGICFGAGDCPVGYTCKEGQCIPAACATEAECATGHVCSEGVCVPMGDPAMILAVPVEQWQSSYVFLTPDSYAKDYVNIVLPSGANVEIDGSPVAVGALEEITGSGYWVYRGLVADGTHRVTASHPVSIMVYGYDRDVSYGYPGGLGLATIPP